MAQAMVARTNVLVQGNTSTVVWKKAYVNENAGVYTWGVVGDSGTGDPDPTNYVSIAMILGSQSAIDSGFYFYNGLIVESYTYTLYVDSVAQEGMTGVMLFSMDLMPHIALNDTHRAAEAEIHGLSASSYVVGTIETQTLTNKTITSPSGIVKGDVGLGNVDNTSDSTKNAAEVTLTNKTLTGPIIATIYQDACKENRLTLPVDTDTLAVNDDMVTTSSLITTMADGSANSNEVIKTIAALAVGNTRFAAQISANTFISYGTDAASVIAPKWIGQIYVKTDTSLVYIAKGLTTSDWITVS